MDQSANQSAIHLHPAILQGILLHRCPHAAQIAHLVVAAE